MKKDVDSFVLYLNYRIRWVYGGPGHSCYLLTSTRPDSDPDCPVVDGTGVLSVREG